MDQQGIIKLQFRSNTCVIRWNYPPNISIPIPLMINFIFVYNNRVRNMKGWIPDVNILVSKHYAKIKQYRPRANEQAKFFSGCNIMNETNWSGFNNKFSRKFCLNTLYLYVCIISKLRIWYIIKLTPYCSNIHIYIPIFPMNWIGFSKMLDSLSWRRFFWKLFFGFYIWFVYCYRWSGLVAHLLYMYIICLIFLMQYWNTVSLAYIS